MKIYSVTIGETRFLWAKFQSAAQSHAYWLRRDPGTVLEAVHVPDDAWKPVDKRTEARLTQVQTLWEQLMASDPDSLDALLDELVRKVTPPAASKLATMPVLSSQERTEAMRALDQLVL